MDKAISWYERNRDRILEDARSYRQATKMAEILGTSANSLGVKLCALRKKGLIGRRYQQFSGVR